MADFLASLEPNPDDIEAMLQGLINGDFVGINCDTLNLASPPPLQYPPATPVHPTQQLSPRSVAVPTQPTLPLTVAPTLLFTASLSAPPPPLEYAHEIIADLQLADLQGLQSVAVERWGEDNTCAYIRLSHGLRRIRNPTGVLTYSPLARHRVVQEDDGSFRLLFDHAQTYHSLNYQLYLSAIDRVAGHDFAMMCARRATEQRQHDPLTMARYLVSESANGPAMMLLDWELFVHRTEAIYLSRYLDRPITFLTACPYYHLVAKDLSRGRSLVELYLQGILSLSELKRWARHPHRHVVCAELEPVTHLGGIELPGDVPVEVPVPEFLLDSSTLRPSDWEQARTLYQSLVNKHNGGHTFFQLGSMESMACVRLLISAKILELKERAAEKNYYRFCHENWDGRRLRHLLRALLLNDGAVQPDQYPPPPTGEDPFSDEQSQQQMGVPHLLMRLFERHRALLVYNALRERSDNITLACNLARWIITPQMIPAALKALEEGTFFTGTRLDSLEKLPLLAIRDVHLWTTRELVTVLCKIYMRSTTELNQGELQAPIHQMMHDMDRVPMLLIEGDFDCANPIIDVLGAIFKDLAQEHPHVNEAIVGLKEISQQPVTDGNTPIRQRVFYELSKSVKSWRTLMRLFAEELNKPDGSLRVTNRPTSDDVCIVNAAADIATWRYDSKPLCLSRRMLSSKIQPRELYLYWSNSATNVLYLEADTVEEVLGVVFRPWIGATRPPVANVVV